MVNLFLAQYSFAGGELAPTLWGRQDLAKYNVGLRKCENFIVHPHGSVSKRKGLKYARMAHSQDLSKNIRLVPFQYNLEANYLLEFGNCYVAIHSDDKIEQTIETTYSAAELEELNFAQSAAVVFICHKEHSPAELRLNDDGTWSLSDLKFKNGPFITKPAEMAEVTIQPEYTVPPTVKLHASSDIFNSKHKDSIWCITSNVEEYVAEKAAAGTSDEITVYKGWQFETGGFWKGHVYLKKQDENGNWKTVKSYYSATNSSAGKNFSDSGEVDEATLFKFEIGSDWVNTPPEGNPETDAGYVRFTRGEAVHNCYIKISSVFDAHLAFGKAITELADEDATVLWQEGAWSDYRGWPSCVSFFQERLVFANTKSEPQTFWMSQTGDYYDFGVSSPVVDSDMVSGMLVSRKVSGIKHLVLNNNVLVALTSDTEWLIGSSLNEPMTPTNITTKVQSYCGAAAVEPVLAGKMILYVQEQGCRVRSLGYDFSSDSYTGLDLSLMANHLFEDTDADIKDWAFQKEPDSIIWIVKNDGQLVSLTYLQEQDVIAWARHPLGAGSRVESVASVQTRYGDVLYLSVLRNGKRTIEYLTPIKKKEWLDDCFLDGAVVFKDDTEKQSVCVPHLAGLKVAAVVDGNVEHDLQAAADGTVMLKYAGKRVHVGVPYSAELETLDLVIQRQDGTQLGRRMRIAEVVVRVNKARGVFCGSYGSALEDFKERSSEDFGAPIERMSGDLRFNLESGFDEGRVRVSAPLPFSCTVLAVVPVAAVPAALG